MADFVEEENQAEKGPAEEPEHEKAVEGSAPTMIDASKPVVMVYCPVCSMPPEFCEFGTCFDKCLPWIVENCPEVLSEEVLAEAMGKVSLEGGEGEEVIILLKVFDPNSLASL
jgi:hypothetical protein